MRGKRLCRTLVYACAFLVVFAVLAHASPSDAPRDIAKLPSAEATAPADGGKTQVAQLPGDASAPPTATELIRQAYDYMFYGDFANERACLARAGVADVANARWKQ